MEASATVAAARLSPGPDAAPHLALARSVERRIAVAMMAAHTLGALDVFAFLFWVFPAPNGTDLSDHLSPNLWAIAIYLPLTLVLGSYLGHRMSPTRWAWIQEGRTPTDEERDWALRIPERCLRMDGGMWLGGLVLFTAINLPADADLAMHIGTTIMLGGITTCAVAYLLSEKIVRPVTELALAGGPPRRRCGPGVEGRLLLAWTSASGIPLLGVLFIAMHGFEDATVSRQEMAVGVLVLASVAIAFGLAVMLFAARAVSRPLTQLRRALARVEAGDLSAEVPVDDASEVGLLQSGFNRMVAGLREREHMAELFSRHVGEEVAREALAAEPRLGGGSVTEVAVLFVDMIGSTAYATQAPPEHVVTRLNRFFAIVVDVVGSHGGWVNKFEGDAALCVFGAPVPHEDPAACALAAARDLRRRLREEMPSADAGIGVSAGPAVAGWVGAERRFEYTVIGDPVNEAARLCELAKTRDGRLLASEAILTRAAGEERNRWRLGDAEQLRGRPTPTRLAAPA
jgi:adenylate cyclase